MAVHTELTPSEAADRLALRELFDAYARCADRRDGEGQKALFTGDTPLRRLHGRRGQRTDVRLGGTRGTDAGVRRPEPLRGTHFNGQSTVTIDGDHATGESYTIAHHLFTEDGERKIMIASLRYLDTFAKIDGGWVLRRAEAPPRLERDPPVDSGHVIRTNRFVGFGSVVTSAGARSPTSHSDSYSASAIDTPLSIVSAWPRSGISL